MTITKLIIDARNRGLAHCGIVSLANPSIESVAREFGLKSEAALFHEIDRPTAERLAQFILYKDLAYEIEIMPQSRANDLAHLFIEEFGDGSRYFTNGWFNEGKTQTSKTSWSGPCWNPVTNATFDTGVLIINPRLQGCLWVEDED